MIKDVLPLLRSYIGADAQIAAMVLSGSVLRIYPMRLPQGMIQTSITYRVVPGGRGDYHTDGPSGLVMRRVQLNTWAKSVSDAFHLANLIKDRIEGFRGDMVTNTSPPVAIGVQGIFFEIERDDYAADIAMNTFQRDYTVVYGER